MKINYSIINWNMCYRVDVGICMPSKHVLFLNHNYTLAHVVETSSRVCSGRTTADNTNIPGDDIFRFVVIIALLKPIGER